MAKAVKSSQKKRYVERPDVRKQLLDAAEALIIEEGYAAATVRRIASKAGLKHQAVFYYFGTQDELLLALYRRTTELYWERLTSVLNSDNPIRGLWDVVSDPATTGLELEFLALANHNENIRAEIASKAEALRAMETEAIKRYLERRGIERRLSPQLVSMLTNAMARLLVQEATLGIHAGHEEVIALVERFFSEFEASDETSVEVEPIVEAMSAEN